MLNMENKRKTSRKTLLIFYKSMVWITNLEFTSEAMCPPREGFSGLSGGA